MVFTEDAEMDGIIQDRRIKQIKKEMFEEVEQTSEYMETHYYQRT